MPRSQIPKRTAPKDEISHPVEPHNRPYTGVTAKMPEPVERSVALQRQWDRFKEELRVRTPSSQSDFINAQPMGIQEMCYILVETCGSEVEKRTVLAWMPKPGKLARERFAAQVAAEGAEPEPQGTNQVGPAAVVAEALTG